MLFDDDPVGSGFVASLARPGGNITGLSAQAPEITGKQLELLKEIVPKLSRVGLLGDVTRPGIPQVLREINVAADAFRVQVQYLEVRAPKDIETAFRAASKERADAVVVLGSPVLNSQQKQVVALAVKNRLAVMYSNREFVEAGGLMSYGVSIADLSHRAAAYVDKILKVPSPPICRWSSPRNLSSYQSQSRQADRPDDSAQRAGAGGSGDQVTERKSNARIELISPSTNLA